MGPPAIFFGAVAAVGTKAVIDDRNDRRREAQEEYERMQRQARELEQKRIRDEAENKRKLEEKKRRQDDEKRRLEEELKKQKELERQKIERLKREKELEDKKREEEKEEKERKRQQQIKEALNFYEGEKKNYENNKLNEILTNFQNSVKNDFCSNQAYLLEDLIKKEINKIFKDLDEHINKKTQEVYSSNLQNIKNELDNKNRILLIGKSGVGKSTLINAIFDYDLAETGIGRPITMYEKPKKYEYFSREGLELFDTRGIELDPNYGIEKTSKVVEVFIKDQLIKKEPINSIWYCITGNKIENIELNLIKKLKALYKDDSLPVIIVYTQCIDDETFDEIKNYIETQLSNKVNVKKILAKAKNVNGINCKRYGLEELLNETKEINERNKEFLDISTAKIKANEKMESILNESINIDNDIQFEKKIERIILSFFQKYGNSSLNQNNIKLFYTEYKNKCNSIIKEQLNEIVNKAAHKMKIDLSDIVTKVIRKYGNIISINQEGYYNEYQSKINNTLYNIAYTSGFSNINSKAEKKMEKEIKAYIIKKIKIYISSL